MSVPTPVWRALAAPVRREILDLLRGGPLATGEIARHLPQLSRFAVMQHLGVLEEAGVVLSRRVGRRRINHLNPVPIREIYERWVSRFAERDAQALLALRRHVEGEGRAMEEARKVTLESEIRLKASPERVWKAVTDEQGDWYPYSYGGERCVSIVTEPRVGGRVYEDWGEGAGYLYSTVAHWDPPRALGTRGYLRGAITLEQWIVLERDGDETVLKASTVTFGSITEDMAEAIRSHGDMKLFEDKLRAWVERGERASA